MRPLRTECTPTGYSAARVSYNATLVGYNAAPVGYNTTPVAYNTAPVGTILALLNTYAILYFPGLSPAILPPVSLKLSWGKWSVSLPLTFR